MMPSKKDITIKIKEMLPSIDIQNTGIKQFIKLLSKEFDIDLKSEKKFITGVLTEAIVEHSQNSSNNDDDNSEKNDDDDDDEDGSDQEEEEEEDDDDEQEEESDKEDTTRKTSSKRNGANGTSTSTGGLSEPKEISSKLAGLLKKGKTMSRTDIVKSLWEYIRENNLQNPNNKREIVLDTKMKHVFNCTTFTMFTMNKYIGAHIYPFKPVNLDVNTTISKRDKRKASDKLDKKKNGKKSKKTTTVVVKRKAGTQPPYRLSDALQAVVYEEILPRPQVVSKIWEYIRTNNLQNINDKREILCDDKLQLIFKKSKVTMFQMNALLGIHFLEKVDKSLYIHKNNDNNDDDDTDNDDNDSNKKGNVKNKSKKQLKKESSNQSEGEEEENNEDHDDDDD